MPDRDRCCCFRAARAAVDSFKLMMSFTRKTWYFSVCVSTVLCTWSVTYITRLRRVCECRCLNGFTSSPNLFAHQIYASRLAITSPFISWKRIHQLCYDAFVPGPKVFRPWYSWRRGGKCPRWRQTSDTLCGSYTGRFLNTIRSKLFYSYTL